jgi:hypothetical protein
MKKQRLTGSLLKGIGLLFASALFCGQVNAQVELRRNFQSAKQISAFDNTVYCTAFLSEGSLLTLRDIYVCELRNIDRIIFNPTGSSIAVMRGDKPISVYSFRERNRELFELKDKRKGLNKRANLPFVLQGEAGKELMKDASKGDIVNIAMCYTDDARHFVASNSLGEIIIYDTKEYLPEAYIQGEATATVLAVSSNKYFIAAGTGNNLDIWNFQTKELRKTIPMDANVNEMDFSDDASQLAVVTGDNVLTIFDTKNWEKIRALDTLGVNLSAPSFHPEGKYISVVRDGRDIVVVNLKNNKVEQTLAENPGVTAGRFFMDKQNSSVFMISNRAKEIVFWDANGLNPFFGKLVNKEVDTRMGEWIKMIEGESMEDYGIRVNDETRLKQQALFAQEVATELAGDRVSLENPFVGDYDESGNVLSIGFNSLPPIVLEVPSGEAGDFKDGKNLKFNNAVYVLNDNDEFELAYVEVLNETTNKVYIYDNIGRVKLTAIEDDEGFVPLDVMQLASQEEELLKEVMESVVEEKKQDKLITENTHINVMTEVVSDVDANGRKILNYKVGYQYEVINKEFSAKEDFPSGGYDIEQSNAAMSLMKIIKDTFEGSLDKYLGEGKQVNVIITGSADGSPVRGRIAYNGKYGEYTDEPYYKDGNLDYVTVTKTTGITSNEQLALVRAAGVKNYIEKNITTLEKTKNEYEYYVEVAKERGGEFRKITIEFMIVDAFPVQ